MGGRCFRADGSRDASRHSDNSRRIEGGALFQHRWGRSATPPARTWRSDVETAWIASSSRISMRRCIRSLSITGEYYVRGHGLSTRQLWALQKGSAVEPTPGSHDRCRIGGTRRISIWRSPSTRTKSVTRRRPGLSTPGRNVVVGTSECGTSP